MLVVEWTWVLALKWRSLGELSLFDTTWGQDVWWTNVLNLAPPPQRFRPDTRLEHQDIVSHMTQKKREKKKSEINKIKKLFTKKN